MVNSKGVVAFVIVCFSNKFVVQLMVITVYNEFSLCEMSMVVGGRCGSVVSFECGFRFTSMFVDF